MLYPLFSILSPRQNPFGEDDGGDDMGRSGKFFIRVCGVIALLFIFSTTCSAATYTVHLTDASGATSGWTVEAGYRAQLTAAVDPQYPNTVLIAWTGDCSGQALPTCVLIVNSDKTVGVKVGTAVTLTAKPDKGSRFNGWSGDYCTGNAATCSFVLDKNATVNAEFKKIPKPKWR